MKRVLVFGGTTEGKKTLELLERLGIEAYVSVATQYGAQTLDQKPRCCEIITGRLDASQMADFLSRNRILLVIDATHPYAVEVTANIKTACAAAGNDAAYLRLARGQGERLSDALYFPGMEEAAQYLCGKEGNVLLTTGSKDLACFTVIDDFKSRVYARILPAAQSADIALAAGYLGEHLIFGQGPFSERQNVDILKKCGARYLVTKDTGAEGGLPQKASAARRLGVRLLIVERPKETGGVTLEELAVYLQKERGRLCGDL